MPQKLLSTCVTGNIHLGHNNKESAVNMNTIDYFGDITQMKDVEDNNILCHVAEDNDILSHRSCYRL